MSPLLRAHPQNVPVHKPLAASAKRGHLYFAKRGHLNLGLTGHTCPLSSGLHRLRRDEPAAARRLIDQTAHCHRLVGDESLEDVGGAGRRCAWCFDFLCGLDRLLRRWHGWCAALGVFTNFACQWGIGSDRRTSRRLLRKLDEAPCGGEGLWFAHSRPRGSV